jgi:alcohol dehydrogenase class IV
MSFTFTTAKQIISENGSAARLAELTAGLGGDTALIVTDPLIRKLGLLDSALAGFANSGVEVEIYDQVLADPADTIVLEAVAKAKAIGAQAIIGFGGGSSMDVAKLVAFLAHPDCSQELADIYGVEAAKGERLPLIQVPTTAGTGSEVTAVAIITTGETTKSGAVSPIFLPDIALLDASLTTGLPPAVTAATGIDAMVHAIEAYTSKHKKNPISDMLAREALSLLANNIETAVHNGSDIQARQNMLLGAMMAGQAFANSPVAAVHALAYPLGGHFHIPHGLSNSLVLPYVLRFNAEAAAGQYAELAAIILGDKLVAGTAQEATEQLIAGMVELIEKVGLPARLRDMDIPEDFLPTLASDAMLQQRLLINNPVDVTEADALAIYTAAY